MQKGKNVIPDHTLALSFSTDKSAYPNVEVDYQTAIAYLRHEAIVLSSDAPRGIVLLTYKGYPIGFAKNLGNRANKSLSTGMAHKEYTYTRRAFGSFII